MNICAFGPCEEETKRKFCGKQCKTNYYNALRKGLNPEDPNTPWPQKKEVIPTYDCSTCLNGFPSKHADKGYECSLQIALKCKPYLGIRPIYWE